VGGGKQKRARRRKSRGRSISKTFLTLLLIQARSKERDSYVSSRSGDVNRNLFRGITRRAPAEGRARRKERERGVAGTRARCLRNRH